MAEFEELMQRLIGEESDRKALIDMAGRYPGLKSAVMAQDDYSRKMNENQAKLAALDQWEKWRETNWDDAERATRSEVAAKAQVATLQTRISELEAMGGGDVDFGQVLAELGKNGYATKDQIKQELSGQFVERDSYTKDVTARINHQGSIFEDVAGETIPLVIQHQRDFGEVLRPKALWKFMSDNNLGTDVNAAYEKMYEPRLRELREQRAKVREDEIRREEREKTLQEQAATRANPVDNSGTSRVMGHLEASKIARERGAGGDAPGLEKAELGANTIASVAAQDYRSDPSKFQKSA